MVFHWNLSHSKSPQASKTLLSILTDTPCKFLTPAFADGLSLKFESQQVSSSIQDTS